LASLRLINENDIENLRVWKNSHKDSFFCKDDITQEQQQKWYKEYAQRNQEGNDFMYIVMYEGEDVGCIGYRLIDDYIDIYNVILGKKEYEGKKIISTASKTLWESLKAYNKDITVMVLTSNTKTINWYLKNNWTPLYKGQVYYVLKYEG